MVSGPVFPCHISLIYSELGNAYQWSGDADPDCGLEDLGTVPHRKKGDNAVQQLEHSSGHPNWEGQGPVSAGLPAGAGLYAGKMGVSGQDAAHQRCR